MRYIVNGFSSDFAVNERILGSHVYANNASYDPNKGITIDEAKNIIDYLFTDYSPTLSDGSLSQNEIIAQYSCNVPTYITGIISGTHTGHRQRRGSCSSAK